MSHAEIRESKELWIRKMFRLGNLCLRRNVHCNQFCHDFDCHLDQFSGRLHVKEQTSVVKAKSKEKDDRNPSSDPFERGPATIPRLGRVTHFNSDSKAHKVFLFFLFYLYRHLNLFLGLKKKKKKKKKKRKKKQVPRNMCFNSLKVGYIPYSRL